MHCTHCGAALPTGTHFCPHCGTILSPTPPAGGFAPGGYAAPITDIPSPAFAPTALLGGLCCLAALLVLLFTSSFAAAGMHFSWLNLLRLLMDSFQYSEWLQLPVICYVVCAALVVSGLLTLIASLLALVGAFRPTHFHRKGCLSCALLALVLLLGAIVAAMITASELFVQLLSNIPSLSVSPALDLGSILSPALLLLAIVLVASTRSYRRA